MKRFTFASLFIVSALLLSSCSLHLGLSKLLPWASASSPTKIPHVKATPTPSAVVQIKITSTGLDPQTLTIKAGTAVTWTNNDTVAHTIVTDNLVVNSGAIAPGATFTFEFRRTGTYSYHTAEAPNVTATITVTQ